MFLVFYILAFLSCCSLIEVESKFSNNGTFYYFAYGSNMLGRRIHLKNPSAKYFAPAILKNYRLDFNMYEVSWNGAVATIVQDDSEDVWGVLWKLNTNQVKSLDNQEGVHLGWYYVKNVIVTTATGKRIMARTYEQTLTPSKTLNKTSILPVERRPSNTYLEVIALGAIESRLPADYIGYIFSFPTNGLMASNKRRNQLGYPF